MIKSSVKGTMQSVLQAIKSKTWLVIVIDSLDSREFPSLDPVHQFLSASTFVCYFLDFVIEEESLDVFDCLLELFPVFETS